HVMSTRRPSGYGNSYGKGRGVTRRDYMLVPPPMPKMPELAIQPQFAKRYAGFLAEMPERMLENEQLLMALADNLGRVDRNHYNIEVFLALARFAGHHWRLLTGLASAERSLDSAYTSAMRRQPGTAIGHLVAAYNTVNGLHKRGEEAFSDLKAVYEKSRYPKGRSVDGRQFFHQLDDTKDHWADRTPDLGFMMAPERGLGLDQWQQELSELIRTYAKEHNIPVKGLAEVRLEE
ncbi:MAG: hypothetical protein GY953_17345, partial [bacterium]|nr:hypothetical protein [bacterium]